MPRTTISLDPETRDRLKALGRKGETYDALVNRLIDHFLGLETRGPRGTEAGAQARAPGRDEVDFEQVR